MGVMENENRNEYGSESRLRFMILVITLMLIIVAINSVHVHSQTTIGPHTTTHVPEHGSVFKVTSTSETEIDAFEYCDSTTDRFDYNTYMRAIWGNIPIEGDEKGSKNE